MNLESGIIKTLILRLTTEQFGAVHKMNLSSQVLSTILSVAISYDCSIDEINAFFLQRTSPFSMLLNKANATFTPLAVDNPGAGGSSGGLSFIIPQQCFFHQTRSKVSD
jgi:hypothetical protein